jgi:hypothetical protein
MDEHSALPKSPPDRAPRKRARHRWAVAGAAAAAVLVLAGCASTSSSAPSTTTTTTTHSAPAGGPRGAGGGSNARSGPAEGGSTGTVSAVSSTGFTLSTSTGEKVTVNETSSTTYAKGTSSTSASAVTNGEAVLVLGMVDSQTITAGQVIVQPATGSASDAAQVVPFQQGSPSTAKSVGQVPTDYTEGSGTIMTGTTADKAAQAALADYPGGIVDRVVQLASGEYEVHYIGVNWPHHVFVSEQFQVQGAD